MWEVFPSRILIPSFFSRSLLYNLFLLCLLLLLLLLLSVQQDKDKMLMIATLVPG